MTNTENIDQELLDRLSLFSRWSGPLVALVGLITVIAHAAEITCLQLATGGVAVSFLLAGLALSLLGQAKKSAVTLSLGYGLALATTLLALLNVGRYFFHLEIANFFASMTIGDFEIVRLVAMPPSDAIALFLIGLVLLLTPIKVRGIRPAEVLAFAATLICVMTLLGVLLKVDTFCAFMSCARISAMGESVFTVLCIGTLLAQKDGLLPPLLASKSAGGMVARILIPAALAVPILASWLHTQIERAGVPGDISLALMIFGMVLCFALILGWSAWTLENIDRARQQATARLRQSERRTRMIVEQAIDSFVAADGQGLAKDWNDRAEYTFGWSKAEVIDKSIIELIVPDRFRAGARELLHQLASDADAREAMRPYEATAQHKDGHEFPVELSFFPVVIDEERIFCAFVRDITERKEMEQRLKEFYSTVSHELRSPLTSIRGSVRIIKEELSKQLGGPAQSLIEIADNSLDRLIRLINDLLDIKRIEEGHMDLELQPIDTEEVVLIAVSELRSLAAHAQVELKIVSDHRAVVSADPDRIVQVLSNLITNAIKFSPAHGCVIVRTATSHNDHRARISVEDQGPGILPAEAQKLFSKFGQLADGRKKLGTGLGLAISKAIVEQHGGEIGIECQEGKGSNFWFELPTSAERIALDSEQMRTINMKAIPPRNKDETLSNNELTHSNQSGD